MITASHTVTIVAMPTAVAGAIRTSLHDLFGNRLAPQVDDGSAPCRHCLSIALPGEEVILFSYRPFERPSLYQEVGPVFIHARECSRYAREHEFPPAFLRRGLVLRPYDRDDNICFSQVYAGVGEGLTLAQQLLSDPSVEYVHARSVTRGCYLFRVERGPAV